MRTNNLRVVFDELLKGLRGPNLEGSGVIVSAAPIPAFGDVSKAELATVALNPSNREFEDTAGGELDGELRRFHTLRSLRLSDWSHADAHHVRLMIESCSRYFSRNPYDKWFKPLDRLLSPTSFSLYGSTACHLDLVPYATSPTWGHLTPRQQSTLRMASKGALALLLANSKIRVLVLNGESVVRNFQEMARARLIRKEMPQWALQRQNRPPIRGVSYRGMVERLDGVSFPQPILVLGYNHNIQSSFGVTGQVISAIGFWLAFEVRQYHLTAASKLDDPKTERKASVPP